MMYGSGYNGFGSCFAFGPRFMFGGLGMVMMTVFLLLVAAAVIYWAKRNSQRQVSNEALETLKMRFVKGEIDEEEFSRRKTLLD